MSDLVPREEFLDRHPLLTLKNVVVFPRNVVTLLVGRPRSVRAVDHALISDRRMVVTAHRDPDADDPRPEDLHHVGTMVAIVSSERQSAGNVQVVLEGICRVKISDFDNASGFFTVVSEPFDEPDPSPAEARALIAHVQNLANRYADARGALPVEVQDMVQRASDPSHLADLLATQLLTDVARRQALLEIAEPLRRLEHVAIHLSAEIDVAALERRIKDRVRDQIDRNQREYYLREQLKAIHDELGGENGNEFDTLRAKVAGRGMPPIAEDRVLKEIARLERMPGVSAEATVVRTYLDTVLALPWHESTADRLDLLEAERILDADHFGLELVKERILDFLAVRKLTSDANAHAATQILCLVGPPGVGKTSLGRSIATAMGRSFVRVSLGGVRDEAEIRGHRRTYIGAMPGRIISAMKQAGTINPVLLLDEIDKLSSDYRGDPASAMLEVLDPEQNKAFGDHFLDLPYDLSRVLFLTTANNISPIPRPLRDRMEIIEIPGYTEEEKIEIGRRYLLPKQIAAHGLAPKSIAIPAKSWVRLVRDYTREAGVRQLERELAAICRRLAREVVRGKGDRIRLTESRLFDFLGSPRFGQDLHLGEDTIGLAIGLGVTEIGGELLPVEVATMPGKGSLTITGKAGDVMQESAHAAVSYARSRAEQLKIDPDFQAELDLHIHLPEGATPKDGPSAGITMATALISALTRRPVRGDTAMTGEITLRGRVLAIGGFREKALAAHRHGIRRIIAPKENARDLAKLPPAVRRDTEIIFAASMDQVIAAAIRLDETQVGGLLEGIEPAIAVSTPSPLAAASLPVPGDVGRTRTTPTARDPRLLLACLPEISDPHLHPARPVPLVGFDGPHDVDGAHAEQFAGAAGAVPEDRLDVAAACFEMKLQMLPLAPHHHVTAQRRTQHAQSRYWVSLAEWGQQLEQPRRLQVQSLRLDVRVDLQPRRAWWRRSRLYGGLLERCVQVRDHGLLQCQPRRPLVPSMPEQQVPTFGQSRRDIEPWHRPRRSMSDAIRQRHDDHRPIEAVGELARRQTNDSSFPFDSGEHQHSLLEALRLDRQRRLDLLENILLQRAAALIRHFRHVRQFGRFAGIGRNQELVGRPRIFQAPWGVQARRNEESDVTAGHFPHVDACRLAHRAQARSRRLSQPPETIPHQGTIDAGERRHVADQPDHRQVEQWRRLQPGTASCVKTLLGERRREQKGEPCRRDDAQRDVVMELC